MVNVSNIQRGLRYAELPSKSQAAKETQERGAYEVSSDASVVRFDEKDSSDAEQPSKSQAAKETQERGAYEVSSDVSVVRFESTEVANQQKIPKMVGPIERKPWNGEFAEGDLPKMDLPPNHKVRKKDPPTKKRGTTLSKDLACSNMETIMEYATAEKTQTDAIKTMYTNVRIKGDFKKPKPMSTARKSDAMVVKLLTDDTNEVNYHSVIQPVLDPKSTNLRLDNPLKTLTDDTNEVIYRLEIQSALDPKSTNLRLDDVFDGENTVELIKTMQDDIRKAARDTSDAETMNPGVKDMSILQLMLGRLLS
jgi:hypothetical protein